MNTPKIQTKPQSLRNTQKHTEKVKVLLRRPMKRPLCYPNTLEPGYDPSQKAAHIYYKNNHIWLKKVPQKSRQINKNVLWHTNYQ